LTFSDYSHKIISLKMKKFKPSDHIRLLGLLKLHASSKGIRIKDLAKENGLSPSGLYNAFYFPLPGVERIIANILNLRPQEIWPERYDSEGRPNRGRQSKISQMRTKSTKKEGVLNGHKVN
jgi:Ner family transcriptional regulator